MVDDVAGSRQTCPRNPRSARSAPRRRRAIGIAASLTVALPLFAGGASALAAPSRVRLVDFRNNHSVIRDRQSPLMHQSIADFDGDAIEWKDLNGNGATEKNWPVAFTRATKPTLDAEFAFRRATAPHNYTITGKTTVAGVQLTWTGVAAGGGGKVLKIAGITSDNALPDEVLFVEPMRIVWEATAGRHRIPLGTSSHNLYTTLRDPTDTVYFTLLHFTSHDAFGATTEADTVAGLWSEYTDRVVRRRGFVARSGQLRPNGTRLSYWGPLALCGAAGSGVADLLARPGGGRCDQWGPFLANNLAMEGIASTVKELDCAFPLEAPAVGEGDCFLLVKNWTFAVPTGGAACPNWPFAPGEYQDQIGAPGQNNPDPPGAFNFHVVTEYGGQLYDPSYGTGPFATLGDWEDASLDGFYTTVNANCLDQARGNVVGTLETTIKNR